MKSTISILAVGALCLLQPSTSNAAELFGWNNHAAPFSFRFGNEIDAHQQSRATRDGGLVGLLYVQFTGTTTKDGFRVATHGDCNASHCSVGWTFNARPMNATLLEQDMGDHPLFSVARADIPQPGAFSHFHWLGEMPATGQASAGYVMQLLAVDRFCFIHHDAVSASASHSCRDNGGIPIDLGLDAASHLNIVPTTSLQDM